MHKLTLRTCLHSGRCKVPRFCRWNSAGYLVQMLVKSAWHGLAAVYVPVSAGPPWIIPVKKKNSLNQACGHIHSTRVSAWRYVRSLYAGPDGNTPGWVCLFVAFCFGLCFVLVQEDVFIYYGCCVFIGVCVLVLFKRHVRAPHCTGWPNYQWYNLLATHRMGGRTLFTQKHAAAPRPKPYVVVGAARSTHAPLILDRVMLHSKFVTCPLSFPSLLLLVEGKR